MKKNIVIYLSALLFTGTTAIAQKTISEGTLSYIIQIKNTEKSGNVDTATNTIYIRGNQSRTDMVNAFGSETTIADATTGTAVILKQYSGQKLMITLTKANLNDKYSNYEGIIFKPTDEKKIIAGYNCKKAIAQLKNGVLFFVYYAPEFNFINKDYDPIFKNLPGLPVQYEFTSGKHIFNYTLSSVNFNPIPSSKFDIPKAGFRVMTYNNSP